jgi:hypothetical protein
VLHGHGVVERQIRGPPSPDAAPAVVVVHARRFRCQACSAVMTVVPREVLAGFWYAAPAIALALMLHGIEQRSARAVRGRVCAWPSGGAVGWPTLRRWARSPSLWRSIRVAPANWSTRQRAERIATTLAASALVEGELALRVLDGAVRAR